MGNAFYLGHVLCQVESQVIGLIIVNPYDFYFSLAIYCASKVLCRRGTKWHQIHTSSIRVEYTMYMCGVKVAKQLHSSYTTQIRSHKEWHKTFNGLLDISIVKMYIIYRD